MGLPGTHCPPGIAINSSPVVAAYRGLLQQLDAWFQAARMAHPEVPCRSGCTSCCHGPFDISAADVLLVREGFRSLPEAEQGDVRDRAGVLLKLMTALEPAWEGDFDIGELGDERFDRLAEALANEPCPFLDDAGSCRIYENRPLVCRMMGLSMHAGSRVIDNACPIQHRFLGYAELGPQDFDLEQFEEDESAWLEAAALELFGNPTRSDYETAMAPAILLLFGRPSKEDHPDRQSQV